jgi:methionyl-tRNA formyltransferase
MRSVDQKYVVIGSKKWNRSIFDEKISMFPGTWFFFDDVKLLDEDLLDTIKPRYIFVLHWSSMVPDDILNEYECVCFHMTDLPFGRGGSPLQNLIISGHRKTKLTALKMTSELDAGPVYLKEELSLEGSAEEIYIQATYLSAKMIRKLIEDEPSPLPQVGEIVKFKRRNPSQSKIISSTSLCDLFDFIRMLDADGYPNAFLEHNGFRYEFRRATLYDKKIICDVKITKIED